jgi:hypothetical protein
MKFIAEKSMEISFFALPSKQGPLQGRFKPTHDSAELVAGLPISLSTKAGACVRRFETATPLNDGRTESKKDISTLTMPFVSCVTLKRSVGVMCCREKTRAVEFEQHSTHTLTALVNTGDDDFSFDFNCPTLYSIHDGIIPRNIERMQYAALSGWS